MVGITEYGAYIPFYRMKRKTVFGAMGWLDSATNVPGEKAVCNYDEDAVTMAVAAGIACLQGRGKERVEGVYMATCSSPAVERQAAVTVATALDLPAGIRTADFAGCTRAGTTSLVAACDAVKAGTAKALLTCTAECRIGKPGSLDEQNYGDAAAAFLVGDAGVIAAMEASHAVACDFMGHWMSSTDKFAHSWEGRWVKEEGYVRFVAEAVAGLLKKCNLEMKDINKVIVPSINVRDTAALIAKLGLRPDQVQEPVFDKIGDCGNAGSAVMLAAALDSAKPGDRLLVASYGYGSEALYFRVTDEIAKRKRTETVADALARHAELTNYNQYLAFRGVMPVETGIRGEEADAVPIQMSRLWRERREILALCGSRCVRCGTPQYPYNRVCVNPKCGAIDEMEYYSFSDKTGTLKTYTADSLAFSINPPQTYGLVTFEGGGQYWFDITDCAPTSLKVGMPVRMSFRRKFLDQLRGVSGYFWKAVPVLAEPAKDKGVQNA